MTPLLECVLSVFTVVLIVIAVIITVFLVKFLKEMTVTLISIRELTDLAKKEMEPALKSVNNILSTINNVSNATNKQFEFVKKLITTCLGALIFVFGKTKKTGFINGLISGFNIFRKKGDKKCQ